jgi:hypothetical protein
VGPDTVFVLDAHCIFELGELPDPPLSDVLNTMSELSHDYRVKFPDLVWKEVHQRDATNLASIWSKAVAGTACKDNISYQEEALVLYTCPTLIDVEAEIDWQSAPRVAALAQYFKGGDVDVVVVSGDYRPRPDRTNLHEACAALGLEVVRPEAFASYVEGLYSLAKSSDK